MARPGRRAGAPAFARAIGPLATYVYGLVVNARHRPIPVH
jgi:hypothetical protein